MNLSHILPLDNVPQFAQPLEMYLALQLQKKPSVMEVIKDRESYKLIDNGCYEFNKSMDFQELLKVAELIDADEVILPDVMFDARATIEGAFAALSTVKRKKQFNFMAVCQGASMEDYCECLQVFEQIPEVTTIGIPKKFMRTVYDSPVECAKARNEFARYVASRSNKQIHLLGLCDAFTELEGMGDLVRSCDTSLAVELIKAHRFAEVKWRPDIKYSLDTPLNRTEMYILREFMIPKLEEIIDGDNR